MRNFTASRSGNQPKLLVVCMGFSNLYLKKRMLYCLAAILSFGLLNAQNQLTATYNSGSIPTQYNLSPDVGLTDYCTPDPILTIDVPPGYHIVELQVQYNMTAQNGAYMSEQRSYIYSPTLNTGETTMSSGTGTEGTFSYSRSLGDFGYGATGSVEFALRAWRTWTSLGWEGCSTYNNYVNSGSWTIVATIELIPDCFKPLALSADVTDFTEAVLSWTSTGTLFDIEYGLAGFTPTGTPSAGLSGVTNPYTLTGLVAETGYEYYVRQDCQTDGTSIWAGPFSFFTGYCSASSFNASFTDFNISGFSTSGGYTNILNENNGIANDYNNYSNMAVTQSPGGTFSYNITVSPWTVVEVWIDWNQDFVFDPVSELLISFQESSDNTVFTDSVLIPSGTPFGDYRMRVRSRYYFNTTANPCGEVIAGEAEDYTISVVDVPTCMPPSDLFVDGASYNSADLSWTSTGALFDIEYGEAGFTPTGTPSTGYAGITATSVTITGLTAETNYAYYVRQDCGNGDTSLWAGPLPFYTGYCSTSALFSGNGINGFSTSDGLINISNENNDITNSYNDYTNMVVSQSPGGTFNYSISVPAYTVADIWIDLDQNFIFDPVLELLISFEDSGADNTIFTGSLVIPTGTPLGDYRMRIRSRPYWVSATSPCGVMDYGETEDYTISVVEAPGCLPPSGLGVNNLTFNSSELYWTSTGTLFDIEYGMEGFTPTGTPTISGTGNPHTVTIPFSGTYDFYVRQNCGTDSTSTWTGPYTFLAGFYNAGDIPTQYNASPNMSSLDYCTPEPTFSVNVPEGFQITGLQVQYSMTAHNDAYMSEQRSYIYSPTLGVGETTMTQGVGSAAGTYNYNRSASFANGATGTVDFVLRAWRTWTSSGQEGCNTYNNYVNNETWVITPTFEPLPPCPAPLVLSADVTGYTEAILSWMSAGASFDIEYGQAGFTPTGTPSTGLSGVANPYTLTGLTAETNYEYYVRQNCGTDGTSIWAGPYAFFTGYCIPTSLYAGFGYGINGFSTINGYTNILNENNGTANAYNNYSNMAVAQSWGGTFNYSISVPAWTVVEVWVDFNQDLTFDPVSELVASFQDYGTDDTIFTGSLFIPTGTPLGDYRMRIRSRYYWNTTASSCGEMDYGETEDYTFSVVTMPSCLPPSGLTVENMTLNSVDLSWTSTGTLFDIEYGESGFTPTGTPTTGYAGITTTSTTLTGLTAETNYQYYVRQNCGDGGTSIWAGPYAFYTGYCIVTTSFTGDYIDAFSTTEATQNVNYTESSYSGAYVNQAAQIIEQGANESFDFSSSYVGGNHIVNIWIDWNNDMVFDNSVGSTEKVYSEHITGAIQNGTIDIPAGTPPGNYRMRVRAQYSFMAGDADPAPCGNVAWGSTVDFTLSVTSTDPCAGVVTPTGNIAQSLTLGDTLADLEVTGTNLVWYANAALTTELPETTVAVDGTTYYVVSEIGTCQSDALAITVTVIDPCAGVVTPTGDTAQSLTLGDTLTDLEVTGTNLVWYSDEDLTVEIPNTTVAVDGTTYYVVSETDTCQSDALAITVTVTDPCAQITTPTGDAKQTLDEGDTLADLVVNGDNLTWYADADLTISIPSTTVAQDGVTYYVASATDICQSEGLAITVTISMPDPCEGVTVPVPTGDTAQTLNDGQTLADLIVEGENLQWYADEDLTQPLEETHVVENDTTYYVTQATEDGCTSEAFAVTVTTLSTTDFEVFAFSFYPNPVSEVLNLTSNSEITQIDLFNMLGQKVNVFTNANNTQVDMSGLPTGNYIISVTIEGITKTFKVVKN